MKIACSVLRRAGRADHGRRQPLARRRASCRSRRSTSARTPTTGGSGSRPTSSPRAFPASSATGSTRCSRWARSSAASRRSRRSSATPSSSARTAGRCTRAGATRSSSTRPPNGWASTSCAGCSCRRGPRRTSSSAGTWPTTRGASCWSSGTPTRSSRPTRRSPAGRRRRDPRRRPLSARAMDRWILSRAAGLAAEAGERAGRLRRARTATRRISTFIDDLSTWYLRLSRKRFSRNDDTADRAAAFATFHTALVSLARVLAPLLPFLSESMYGNLVTSVDDAAPDSVHLTPLAGGRAGHVPRRAARGGDGDGSPGGRSGPDAARRRRHPRPPAAGPPVDRAARRRPARAGRAARARPRRGQRPLGRADRRRVRPRRPAGEAAAAEDRQAARLGDPRGDGRGPRRRGRVSRRRLGDARRRHARRRTRSRSSRRRGPGPRSPATRAWSS